MPSEPLPEELERILECARQIAGERVSLLNSLIGKLDALDSFGSFDTAFAIAWARLFDKLAAENVSVEDVKRIYSAFAVYGVLGELRDYIDGKMNECGVGKGKDYEIFKMVQTALSVYEKRPVSENGGH